MCRRERDRDTDRKKDGVKERRSGEKEAIAIPRKQGGKDELEELFDELEG
jgi:hypothetical protein